MNKSSRLERYDTAEKNHFIANLIVDGTALLGHVGHAGCDQAAVF